MKSLITAALLFTSISSFASELFTISKSMNPKNVLHYKANVVDCKLNSPAISSYWLMGEKNNQVEGLTSKEKPYFQAKISYSNGNEADFSIGAMEKMGNKIQDQSIRVRLENCKPKAFLDVKGSEVQITGIYVNLNMFMSVSYMTISGIASNGQKVSHRIDN